MKTRLAFDKKCILAHKKDKKTDELISNHSILSKKEDFYRLFLYFGIEINQQMKMNCIIVDDDSIMIKLLESLVQKVGFFHLQKTFTNPIEAQEFIQSEKVDLIFLDVEMPGMTGLDIIKSLQYNPQVILVTAKENYAVDAFNLQVTDFLVKPPTYDRFLQACNRAKENLEERGKIELSQDKLFIKVDSHLAGVPIADIIYVEAMADYVGIHTKEKRYVVYSTMKGIEAKLPSNHFSRVHRSFIVNIGEIKTIEDNTLSVGDKLIPVGVTYKEKLLSSLNLL